MGAGFKLSDGSSPVSLIKYAHRWNPFVDLEDDEEVWGDKFGVCTDYSTVPFELGSLCGSCIARKNEVHFQLEFRPIKDFTKDILPSIG